MPTSEFQNIPAIVGKSLELRPKTILDLGIGCGKYGALLREYLDYNENRFNREAWQVRIVGVEGFTAYENPMWKMYNAVSHENFSVETYWHHYYTGYDLVLMIDSLEHLDRATGEKLLTHLIENNKNVIVSCPDSDKHIWEQGAWGGNQLEIHRSHWGTTDFLNRGGVVFHRGVCTVAWFSGRKK